MIGVDKEYETCRTEGVLSKKADNYATSNWVGRGWYKRNPQTIPVLILW